MGKLYQQGKVWILQDYHADNVPDLANYRAVDVGIGQDVDVGHRGAGQLQLFLLVLALVVACVHLAGHKVHHPIHLLRLVSPLVQLPLHAGELRSGAEWEASRVFHLVAASRPVQEKRFASTFRQDFLHHCGVETVGHVIFVTITLGNGLECLGEKKDYHRVKDWGGKLGVKVTISPRTSWEEVYCVSRHIRYPAPAFCSLHEILYVR